MRVMSDRRPPYRSIAAWPDGLVSDHDAVWCCDRDAVRTVVFGSAFDIVSGGEEGDEAHDEIWVSVE